MAAPVIIAAIISAIASKYAADQAQKQAAMQSAAAGANASKPEFEAMKPVSLESITEDPANAQQPTPQLQTQPVNTGAGGTPMPQPVAPPSAIGRTLEQYDKQSLIRPGSTDNSAAYIPPTGSVMPSSQPAQDGAQGGAGGMTSLEMAQLGLMLGSQLFKREKGPPPPGLPSSSFSPMRPVFRG
jgi:hypothetical protein